MLRSPGQSEENFERMHTRNPLRRGVDPEDVVAAIRYFVSARAVTGEIIVIDGGQRFSPPSRDVQFLEDMMSDTRPILQGLVPETLRPRDRANLPRFA